MSAFFKTLAHAFVSAALVSAAGAAQGGAINSRNVLIPAIVAGALAAVHAALPSTLGPSNGN